MRVIALDFDGVLCDSVRETFATAIHTYRKTAPDSAVVRRICDRLGRWPWTDPAIATDPDFERYEALVPLGNRAEDFGVALLSLDLELDLTDQEAYDNFYETLDPTWLDTFHRRFYETRNAIRALDRDAWLALHHDYPSFSSDLHRIAGQARLAIATAKDGRSLDLLLDRLGVSEIFDRDLRFDKETGVQKTAHLTELARRLDIPFKDVTFVDDKVNHLKKVSPLGVRPVLAGWGHNTEREHRAAEDAGYEVATLAGARQILLGETDS
jgi:phosphoglycolate phosphatase-like HAD superfamily hydrolase